jgi:hypothetical protein
MTWGEAKRRATKAKPAPVVNVQLHGVFAGVRIAGPVAQAAARRPSR